MKKLLFAMAIGAALAWLFDPDAGSRRRDALAPQARREGPDRVATPPPAGAAARRRLPDAARRDRPLTEDPR